MYVLIDHNENNLVTPVGYTPDVNAYSQFLKSGIENFKK
jgi:thiol:disulfide interchange protein DsbD